MTEPFASVGDLERRWRPLTSEEISVAEALLGDASVMIRSEAPGIDAKILAGELSPDAPLQVACRVVKRAMQGPEDLGGVSTFQDTAGPFSHSMTFANPAGDLYLAKADRRLLGVGRQQAGSVDTLPEPDRPRW